MVKEPVHVICRAITMQRYRVTSSISSKSLKLFYSKFSAARRSKKHPSEHLLARRVLRCVRGTKDTALCTERQNDSTAAFADVAPLEFFAMKSVIQNISHFLSLDRAHGCRSSKNVSGSKQSSHHGALICRNVRLKLHCDRGPKLPNRSLRHAAFESGFLFQAGWLEFWIVVGDQAIASGEPSPLVTVWLQVLDRANRTGFCYSLARAQ
jgi:hypothetical protein